MRERRSASCGEAPGKRAPRVSAVGAGAEEAQEHPSARTCSRLRRASRSSSEGPSSDDSPWPPRDSCSSFSSAQGSTPMCPRGEECAISPPPSRFSSRRTRSLDRAESRRPFEPRFLLGQRTPFFQTLAKKQLSKKKCESHDASFAATHNDVAHADRETWERCPSGTFERPAPECRSVSARFRASGL